MIIENYDLAKNDLKNVKSLINFIIVQQIISLPVTATRA